MSVEIEDNTVQVESAVKNSVALTLRLVLEDIHRRSVNVTPKRDGDLRAGVEKYLRSPTQGVIEWKMEYAAVQEQGGRIDPRTGKYVVFRNYTTPGTGKDYAANSVRDTMDNFYKIAKQGGLI